MARTSNIKDYLPWIVALISAGLWLGNLQGRVTNLENQHLFEHGTYQMPQGAK